MKRSSVIKDIMHEDLEQALGNWLETGWTIKSGVPSLTRISTDQMGNTLVSVVAWTVVLEMEVD